MKRKSIKTAILIPLLPLLTVGIVVLSLIAGNQASNIAERLTNERVYGASRTVTARLQNLEDQTRAIAVSVAGNYTVTQALRRWNNGENGEEARQELISYLRNVARETKMDSFIVRDAEGVVVLRLHSDLYGDADGSPSGTAALRGETTTTYSSTGTMPLGLNTTAPIRDSQTGEIIGTMTPLVFLHTNDFVDYLSGIFGASVTVFGGNERVATTLVNDAGERVVGTTLEGPIADKVLGEGIPVEGEDVMLFGNRYMATYLPLKSHFTGSPVGMLFVGFSTAYADGAMSDLIRGLVISGLVILLGVALMVYIIVNRQTRKLPLITAAAETISMGDIDIKDMDSGTTPTNNEITKLERAFSHMVESFKQQAYILARIAEGDYTSRVHIRSEKDVINIAIDLMLQETLNVLSQVATAGIQVSDGSKQIADGAQALAQGSSQQAAAVEQLSTSMATIAQKTKDNADMATKAADLAVTIKHNAEKGSRQMSEMMDAVKEINAAGQSISKVIKAIDDIAFQTNILALNAAVEAARAGQHGKGFAVVAEEVRNLASKSAAAAKETGGLIQNSVEKAELGFRIAGETAASLEEIVSGINESTIIVNDIAVSSEEQYKGISQINKGVEQVALVVQQNSATAQQSAAASEQMSGQSAVLEELILQFQLRDNNKKGGRSLPAHND
jgi:methyl-accepting chemotaxis protein